MQWYSVWQCSVTSCSQSRFLSQDFMAIIYLQIVPRFNTGEGEILTCPAFPGNTFSSSSCSRKNSETLSRSWLQKAVITAWLQKCKNHTYSREDTHYDIPWLSSAIKRACLNGGAIPRSLAWLLHSHDYRRNAVRLAIMRCSYVAVRTKEGGGWCALPLSVLLQMQR